MIGKILGIGVASAMIEAAKRIPNDKIKNRLKPVFYRAGVLLTLGLAKSPLVGPVWNRTVEPYVVDLLDNVLFAMRYGLIPGLRSDNQDPRPDPPPGPITTTPDDNENETEKK